MSRIVFYNVIVSEEFGSLNHIPPSFSRVFQNGERKRRNLFGFLGR